MEFESLPFHQFPVSRQLRRRLFPYGEESTISTGQWTSTDALSVKRRCAAMLALKSFRTAQITLAGIELAHRIRKQQFSLMIQGGDCNYSLKDLWDLALRLKQSNPRRDSPAICQETSVAPELKARRVASRLTELRMLQMKSLRYTRKVFDGRGLYLLVSPRPDAWWLKGSIHPPGSDACAFSAVAPERL